MCGLDPQARRQNSQEGVRAAFLQRQQPSNDTHERKFMNMEEVCRFAEWAHGLHSKAVQVVLARVLGPDVFEKAFRLSVCSLSLDAAAHLLAMLGYSRIPGPSVIVFDWPMSLISSSGCTRRICLLRFYLRGRDRSLSTSAHSIL